MKIENGHIIEATKRELFALWLYYEVDEIMPFNEYLDRMHKNGVVIVE